MLSVLLLSAVCAASQPTSPAPEPKDMLLERAAQLRAVFSAEPSWPADLLSPAFNQDKHKRLFAEVFRDLGKMVSITLVDRRSPTSGRFEAHFEKAALVPVSITVGDQAPFSIVGLWLSPAEPDISDIAKLPAEFAKLPGKVSFAIYKLGAKPELLAAHNPDEALAIGSAFKLYILGALAKEIAEGKRRWEDVVRLDPRFKSLPSGSLHTWPDGSPATLHTLAALMISKSDNTATDHLLFTLGRSKVEAMLEPMGNHSPSRNKPFLATAEMFRLKEIDAGKPGEAYLAKPAAERAAYLEQEVARLSLEKAQGGDRAPRAIDTLEWFASASDLCRAMDWQRTHSESSETAMVRGALAINPGIGQADAFRYLGYKGGSEPGVLNLTWLAQGKGGTWWAISAGWNDSKALDEGKLIGLAGRALKLLAASETQAPTARQ